jgi:hypothetical protein
MHNIDVSGTDLQNTMPLFRGSKYRLLLGRNSLPKKLTCVIVA